RAGEGDVFDDEAHAGRHCEQVGRSRLAPGRQRDDRAYLDRPFNEGSNDRGHAPPPGSPAHTVQRMTPLDPSIITGWHAHVYFDAASRDAAWAMRETVQSALAGRVQIGRFHEKAVGPHPMWSFQVAFAAGEFTA